MGRLIELGYQQALLDIDAASLDAEVEALEVRKRAAERDQTLLKALGASVEVTQDKYLDLANRFESFSLESMRGAMRKAFEAELRLAFERGTAARLDHVQPSILTLTDDQSLIALPQKFQEQLNRLSDAVDEQLVETDNTYAVFLSEHDPLALARLQQSGETDFVVSLYDVDKKFPGHPNVRIVNVTIEFDNDEDLPVGGVTVFLTHRGVFAVRDPATLMLAKDLLPTTEALQAASAAFSEGRNLTAEGVTFINAGEERRPFTLGGPPPVPTGTRQGLEGYGVTGAWNFEINKNELPEVEIENIGEVTLTFFVTVGEATVESNDHVDALISTFENSQDRITFFRMRDSFLDELNSLIDANPDGEVVLDLNLVLSEADQQEHLKAVVIQVIDTDRQGIVGASVQLRKPLEEPPPFELVRETLAGGFTEKLDDELPVLSTTFPMGGKWTLGLANPSALKVHDVRWFLIHGGEAQP